MVNLDELQAEKQKLLARVEGWSGERLSYRPTRDCWSAAEVFDHLVKTEEEILAAVKKGLAQPHRVGISDRARTVFLRKVFKSDRRVKVPASATVVLPDVAADMTEVVRRWKAVRAELAEFRGQLSAAQMREGIFRHPVGGWMALPDVIEFFYVHMVHHTFQLERLNVESENL